jgi:hypothetical protein
MTEETIYLTPTAILRAGRGTLEAATAGGQCSKALIVFRSEEEAELFRADTGKYPASEGFKPVALHHKHLKDVIGVCGCSHVAMPEPWGSEGGVGFYEAGAFVELLEVSASAA